MTDAKGHGKSVEELFPYPFFTGAETGQCKSNGSLYAARHLWEEAAKRLKGQIEGQTEKRSPKPYGFRLLMEGCDNLDISQTTCAPPLF